jgi:dephospho-CoA kinase
MRKDKLKGRGTTYCPKCQKVCISLGVTGKIASGKSSVIKYFQTQGYPCFSCDDEVTRLYQKIEVKKELINIFGEQVLNDNLTISKTYIKEIISNDLDKKKALEKYIHPLVKELINKFILSHKEDKIALIEVPLMFETHFNVLFDYIVGITCSYTNQIHHLLERGTKSLNNDLVIAQSNKFDQNISKCDFLINNDGSIQELHFSLDNLISKLSK